MSSINLKVFNNDDPKAGYISWTPVPLTISLKKTAHKGSYTLTSKSLANSGTKLVFKKAQGDKPQDEITVQLTPDKSETIYVAGKFQPKKPHNGASKEKKDVAITIANVDEPKKILGSLDIMIRVRKNANELSDKARQDLLEALAKLNGIENKNSTLSEPGKGIYVTDFVAMHVAGATNNEHGDAMFLPWHRLYLLDLERQLQRINPAVTLPYWRFDQPAPNLFSEDFLGKTEQIPIDSPFTQGTSDKYAHFSPSNPLSKWQIQNVTGIPRASFFNTKKEPANGLPGFGLLDQAATLALGNDPDNPKAPAEFGRLRRKFSSMEGTPHGAAHVSFNGYINYVPVAPKDPLFFLLHCNVDRLWSMWQFIYDRDISNEENTYPYQNKAQITIGLDGDITGYFPDYWKLINANQWPWDNSQAKPNNIYPPGSRSANFTKSVGGTGKDFIANIPNIEDTIDAYGLHNYSNNLGFCYDDVPYDHDRESIS